MEPPPPPPPPSLQPSYSSSFSLLRRCSLSLSSPPKSPPTLRRIPGPAGAIQAAMHRNDPHPPPHPHYSDDVVDISTQEYIHQDSALDFSLPPWIFALDSLRRSRVFLFFLFLFSFPTLFVVVILDLCFVGSFAPTSLKDVNTCLNPHTIPQVVAIVKSCTPNGLGDMIVTLKDPTDTIGASVHRKVLSSGEFGKSITVGSVLILQQVVVFPSSYASCFLNITRKNVVKVISVDCEVQYFPEANLDSAQVCSKIVEMPENTTAPLSTSRRLSEDDQLSCNVSDNTASQKPKEWETSTQASSLSSSKQIESSAYNISKEPILEDRVDFGHKTLGSLGKWRDNLGRVSRTGPDIVVAAANIEDQAIDTISHAWQQSGPELERLLRGNNSITSMTGKRRNLLQNGPEVGHYTPNDSQKHGLQMDISSDPSLVDNLIDRGSDKPNDSESKGSGGLKKQRLGLISRTSVQEWTDEQLCVLEMDE